MIKKYIEHTGSMVLRDRVQLMIESLGWHGYIPKEGEDVLGQDYTYDFYNRPVRVHL